MIRLDLFVVVLPTDGSWFNIEALLDCLDAPEPMQLIGPAGEQVFMFAVDVHEWTHVHAHPRSVCERMGFEYVHLLYDETASYSAGHTVIMDGDQWVSVFIMLWRHQLARRAGVRV